MSLLPYPETLEEANLTAINIAMDIGFTDVHEFDTFVSNYVSDWEQNHS